MSGTSADGIDLALVDFNQPPHQLVASYFQAFDANTRQQITSLYTPGNNEIDQMGALDKLLATRFAAAIQRFLKQQSLTPADISAIGNHGQTIRHRPIFSQPFTLQIGCSQTLACLTGIRVIGKFREKDIALGGQGAPLVPAYHQAIFADNNHDVCVVNIGGISNITYLPSPISKPSTQAVLGFDIGPGNALLDDWYRSHHDDDPQGIDVDGRWADSGTVNQALLTAMLIDPYFSQSWPKSTGREYFHLDWLNKHLINTTIAAEDVQATLLTLTTKSIANTVAQISQSGVLIICGGGANNPKLMAEISQLASNHKVSTVSSLGIDNDSLEAVVFAWLAYAFDQKITGNLPAVTGASSNCVLGISHSP
ncbi:anhydro-N-acetylmuramic acid kinase [Thalassotalea sp. 42_200_T64]|nr:anhydro-N-acetylmuramic acid kinase [Thalassotalea sp. 42_200_T64]